MKSQGYCSFNSFLFITVPVDLEENDDSTYTFDGHEGKFLHKDQMKLPLFLWS
jgi:hypothetical protein